MDPIQYLAQCAQEDQARLNEYATVSPGSPSVLDTAMEFDDHVLNEPRRIPARSFNISTGLKWGCVLPRCSKSVDIVVCNLCKAMRYCSTEHRRVDRPGHRSVCAKIRKAQANHDKELALLKQRAGPDILDEPFRRVNANEYVRAQLALVEALLTSNTAQAVTLSLDHLLVMLQLCRSDPLSAREVVPAMYLRLGYDQEAYDFCHWWADIGHETEYNWLDYIAPYLDTRNADMLEGLDVFRDPGLHLPHIIAITLIKIRLLVKLHSVQRAKEYAGPFVPREIFDTIQLYCTGPLASGVSKIIDQGAEAQHMTILREQIQTLYATVETWNSHFWTALIDPGVNLRLRPASYRQGGVEHMQVLLQNSYNAWSETPGAIGIIEELSISQSHVMSNANANEYFSKYSRIQSQNSSV